MQRIRLSKNVLLEVTNEIVNIPLNTSPKLYVYDYGEDFYKNKQVVLEDGETEERSRSYWKNNNNILLSTTPNFYLDEISTNFHNLSHIDNKLSMLLTSPLVYRKIRLLYAQGFSYSSNIDSVALTTLNIGAILPTSNRNVELLSFYDAYDDSKIKAVDEVLFDNQIFNSGIDLRILDLEYLYNSKDPQIIKIRKLLFDDEIVETLFIEHAGVSMDSIIDFRTNGKDFRKFYDNIKNRTQFTVRRNDEEIICNVSKNDDGSVSAIMEHERYNLEGFLNKEYVVSDIYYVYKFDEYDDQGSFIGSQTYKISSPLQLFDKCYYKIVPNNNTDHIKVTVIGTIETDGGVEIIREGVVVITDVYLLQDQKIDIIIEEEKLVRSDIKEVKKVIYKSDTPKVVNIEKPVFINVQGTLDEIQIFPYNTTIKINTTLDFSNIRQLKLVIGANVYYNNKDDKKVFTIGFDAYFLKDKKYYILDEDENMITHGKLLRE